MIRSPIRSALREPVRSPLAAALATRYETLRNAAIAAARRNNASLWFAGAPADLAGFVFQDSTGTTPATGTDPIGLLLDRQYGAANIGPELVTNGNFDTNLTGWSFVTGGGTGLPLPIWTANGMSITGNGTNFSFAEQTIAATAGKTYEVRFVVRAGSAMYIEGGVVPIFNYTAGSYVYRVQATGSPIKVRCTVQAGNGTAIIDSISVREILGIPALQATAANKPTLSPNSAGYLDMSFDVTNDTLSAALASGGSPAVVSFTDTGEVTGFVSATTSGFVIGNPTVGGRKVGVIVASATALPAADLAVIRAFAGVVRGTPYP